MLETYFEEIKRTRRARNIFWLVVLFFSILLYMFFQGYYFSINVGWEKLLHLKQNESITAEIGAPVVKSFGIINVKVDPNPWVLTINDTPYANSDKSIFDYGKYTLKIRENGYLPITIETTLDRKNPFYINIIRLIKTPVSTVLNKNISFAAPLKNGDILGKVVFGSGSKMLVFNEVFDTGADIINSHFTGSLTYINDSYFRSGEKIYTYDETLGLKLFERPSKTIQTTSPLCSDLTSINGDLFCPNDWVFITGKYTSLKEKIIEANSSLIRTKTSIYKVSSSFFETEYLLPPTLTITGSTELKRLYDKNIFLANGRLYDIDNAYTPIPLLELSHISHIENFSDESILFGKTGNGKDALLLIDARENAFFLSLDTFDTRKPISVTKHAWAYLINNGEQVIIYYKGSTDIIKIAEGKILGIFWKTILFNKENKTEKLVLEGIE